MSYRVTKFKKFRKDPKINLSKRYSYLQVGEIHRAIFKCFTIQILQNISLIPNDKINLTDRIIMRTPNNDKNPLTNVMTLLSGGCYMFNQMKYQNLIQNET